MTKREDALCAVIDELMHHVEQLGCTCATTEQINSRHTQANRRRTDSECSGVALAVTAEFKRRRALKLK